MDKDSSNFRELIEHWRVQEKVGRVWGCDIGGANLKVACLDRPQGKLRSQQQGFPLWRSPSELWRALRALTSELAAPAQIVVTMTGEIADCYASKAEGVTRIVEQCEQAFEPCGVPVRYYSQNGNDLETCWLNALAAQENWSRVAAANWHAVARMWGDYLSHSQAAPGLIADLGSTTLDLTIVAPNLRGIPSSDWERIQAGRLVYTGARRSSLSMILSEVSYRGQALPLAQEHFATIHDAYLITGLADEEPHNEATADGRPATKACAAHRIARLFCSDLPELPSDLIQAVATQAQEKHRKRLAIALSRQLRMNPAPQWILLLGEGESLLRNALSDAPRDGFSGAIFSGSNRLGPEASRIMPAVAAAILA
ncbi:MAG: hypothetical protein JNL67_21695 [Planctomycetaceae bacterium]|nr:hypothetical protein [Planctomycetaceae bacterium]